MVVGPRKLWRKRASKVSLERAKSATAIWPQENVSLRPSSRCTEIKQRFIRGEHGSTDQLWKRHVLDESLIEGHAVACGNLGGSGDSIVIGWRGKKTGDKVGIKIFTSLDSNGAEWKQTLLDDGGMACEDLCLADLNGDGRLDIIAAGRATKNLKIYFNEGAP